MFPFPPSYNNTTTHYVLYELHKWVPVILSALGRGLSCISGAFVGAERLLGRGGFTEQWGVSQSSCLPGITQSGGQGGLILGPFSFTSVFFSLTGNIGLLTKKLPVILEAIIWSLISLLMCWDQQDERKLLTNEQCSSRNSAFSPKSLREEMVPEEFPRLRIRNWGFPTWNSCMYTEAFLFICHLSNKLMAHMYICLWSTRKCLEVYRESN